MNGISRSQSIQAETLEARLEQNGSYKKSALTAFNGKVYLGDGRIQGLRPSDIMLDIGAFAQSQIYGASGESDKLDKLSIYGDAYYNMYSDYKRISDLLVQNPYITSMQIAGAAGEEALTNYETIRKAAKLSTDISGQERILEDLNAFNIATKSVDSDLKHEFIKQTSAVLTADSELPDDQMPGDIRPAFAVGDKEILADGTSYQTNLRDKELKIDVGALIAAKIPGMFAQTIENKVIAIVNALSSTNQGDWDARTTGIFDVRAAAQVDVGIAAVKPYGGPIKCLLNSDTWRLYKDNVGETFQGQKPSNKSTEIVSALHGFLEANPNVEYWINDSITSQSYILASPAYLKYIDGMHIKTSHKNVMTPGQTERTFEFKFNGIFENETGAAFHGATVGA